MTHILYVVHDLSDPAVKRRVSMFLRGGARLQVWGFRRSVDPISFGPDVPIRDFGIMGEGGFKRRVIALFTLCFQRFYKDAKLEPGAVIVARNIESLFLAVVIRRAFSGKIPIVYEVLDIHSMMVSRGALSSVLRAIEGYLMRAVDRIIVSSVAFKDQYFDRFYKLPQPFLLIENKVFGDDSKRIQSARSALRPSGPPWQIGWFGYIRCHKSLEMLADLLIRHPGLFEVEIRGLVVERGMEDFHTVVAETPGMVYSGTYIYPDDLADIYRNLHFAWAIDYSQYDFNSHHLLPNRIYEAPLYGVVPIALKTVETGRWLDRNSLGVLIDAPEGNNLDQVAEIVAERHYASLRHAVLDIDVERFCWSDAGCQAVVSSLTGVQAPGSVSRI